MKKDQKGFSVTEVILVLVIVGLLGPVGWLVYDKQNNKNTDSKSAESKTSTSTDSASTKDSTTTTDVTAKWLLYTSQNKKYTISIPDGWLLKSQKGFDDIYAWNMSDIPYKEGTKAIVEIEEGGRDGSSIAFSLHYAATKEDGAYDLSLLTKVKEYTTSNKISVVKYMRTQTTEPEFMDIPKGTVQYFYEINPSGPKVQIVHDALSGETEQTKNIEKMIDSLKLL